MPKESPDKPSPVKTKGKSWPVALTVAGLIAATILAILAVFHFVDTERQRELRSWQDRLGIIADSRRQAVDRWLQHQRDEVEALSTNATVQLFMTELALSGGDEERVLEAEARLDYLRNLLLAAAERAGFEGPVQGAEVAANLQRSATAGLAVLDPSGRPIVMTDHFASPPEAGDHSGLGFMPLWRDDTGSIHLGIKTPIYALQEDPAPGKEIGYILAVKPIAAELYPLLEQPVAIEPSLEVLLVEQRGTGLYYLSPRADGTPPLKRSLAADTPALAAGFAIDKPLGFATRHDYRDVEVLVTGRQLQLLDWTLMAKVDRSAALAGSEARLTRFLIGLALAVALIGVAIIALWRHGASRRSAAAAEVQRQAVAQVETQRDFLRLIANHQPVGMAYVDENGLYRFLNRRASDEIGLVDASDVSLRATGPAAAEHHLAQSRTAAKAGHIITDLRQLEGDEDPRFLLSDTVPIRGTDTLPGGALIIERDVTAEIRERRQREALLDSIAATLVELIDRRDPHASHHSERVAELGTLLAAEMGLPAEDMEAVRLAGRLMNLGKISVPRRLLTTNEHISEEERHHVRESMLESADLLTGIAFNGPVIESLRQAFEHYDGSGAPTGLAGEEIQLTARILAVANDYVSMISPRAYRKPCSAETAIGTLLKDAGKRYDRKVVVALVNFLENKAAGRAWSAQALPETG